VDRLTSMTVFAKVAAARSFSTAAKELGISQATASKHVQTLEDWIGTRLLHRTTRRVGLTETGENFFAQCTRILEDMETARQTGQTDANLRGNLRIAAPVDFGSTCLASHLVAFMARHPDVLLNVVLCDRPVDIMEEGFDVAIRCRATQADVTGLIVHRFRPLRFVICAAPSYLAANGTPTVPADLALHPCLTDSRHPGDMWRFTGPAGDTEVRLRGPIKTDNGMLRREAGLTGAGVLLTPAFLVEDDIAAGRLVRLLPDYGLPEWTLDAVSTTYRGALPKVRSFITFLTSRLG
jgi:DNA-binding transcriptional LysR family regulator